MTSLLNEAVQSEEYKKLGSDNILLTLKPYDVCVGKKYFFDLLGPEIHNYGVDIEGQFKDPEQARKELVQNNKDRSPDGKYSDYIHKQQMGLKKQDPEIMKRLILSEKGETMFYSLDHKQELKKDIDETIKVIINGMTYCVPEEPKKYKDNGGADQHYLGEFLSGSS